MLYKNRSTPDRLSLEGSPAGHLPAHNAVLRRALNAYYYY